MLCLRGWRVEEEEVEEEEVVRGRRKDGSGVPR